MHVFFCKKCRAHSLSPVCDRCGAQLTAAGCEQYLFHYSRVPLGDMPTLMGALRVLTLTEIGMLALLLVGELIFSPDKHAALQMYSKSGVMPAALLFFLAGLGVICLVLGLRGREELFFMLDSRKAQMEIWIDPTRIKSLTRFLPFEPYKAERDPEGAKRVRIADIQLRWEDVDRVEFRRRAGRIDLYRPSGFRFMSLYPDRDEMQEIESFILPRMKQLNKGGKAGKR